MVIAKEGEFFPTFVQDKNSLEADEHHIQGKKKHVDNILRLR